MKTVRILMLTALSLSLFACEKETAEKESVLFENKSDEQAEPVTPEREKVAMTFDGNVDEDTKTSLEGLNIRWSSSDNITIFADGDANEFLVKKVQEGGKSATFQGYAAVTDTYYALSPVQEMASISGGVITARIDGEQTAVANSFGAEANVSIAQTGGSRLDFKNVGSLVSITLGNDADNDDITAIEITSKDGTPLAGQVNITYNEGAPELSTLNGSPTVRLSGDFEKGNTYYFVVLPGTHASGLTLTFYKPGYQAVYNNSNSATFTRNKHRSFGSTFNPSSRWAAISDFSAGKDAAVYIDGDGTEIGQKMSFINFAPDSSDDPSYFFNYHIATYSGKNRYGEESTFSDQTFNYEIFTRLKAGRKFWFRSGSHYFSINAAGNAVYEISSPSEAVGTVDNDGIYRIRLNLPSGNAYLAKVTTVQYVVCDNSSYNVTLDYAGRGKWEKKRMSLGNVDNRYRFEFVIGGVTQRYATRYSTDGTPSATKDWYLQPCLGDNKWDPKFKMLPAYKVSYDGQKLIDINLCMNDRYTHSFENLINVEELPSITPGEKLIIQNSPEAGQSLAYVGSDDYWAPSINHSDSQLASYPYDYEIFTKLKAGQNFYFQNEAGNKFFALETGGTSWTALANASAASYSVASDGIYRIRINSGNNNAEIKIISRVEYTHNGVGTRSLTYTQMGTWFIEQMPLKRGSASWDDRYKFKFTFGDSSVQYYGRWSNTGGYPVYETMTKYGYVQPADNNEWEPGFKFPEAYKDITTDRIYGNLTLRMNNDKGHYTHSVTDIKDTQSSFTDGDEMYIAGAGASEAGQKMAYVTSDWWDTTVDGAGDADEFSGQDYNYEIFTRLESGKTIYFHNKDGAMFGINADGTAVSRIYSASGGAYVASSSGIYRIRVNFSNGTAYINKITTVYRYHCDSQTVREMTYDKNGIWRLNNFDINWSSNDVTTDDRYKFLFLFDNSVYQCYGRVYSDEYRPSTPLDAEEKHYGYVQPSLFSSRWEPSFSAPANLYDNTWSERHQADVILYMNDSFGHYTHEYANHIDHKATSISLSGSAMITEGRLTKMDPFLDEGTYASPNTTVSDIKFEAYRHFDAGDCFIQDNEGIYYSFSGSESGSFTRSKTRTKAMTIGTSGKYRLIVDVKNKTWNIESLSHPMLHLHPWKGSVDINTNFGTYEGNGVWSTSAFDWDATRGDVYDARYKIIFWENSGVFSYNHFWGPDGDGDDYAYHERACRYAPDESQSIWHWQCTWNTSENLQGVKVKVKLHLNTSEKGHYYQEIITQ